MARHSRMADKFPSRKDDLGRLCAFCGKRLVGRQRRWCSGECEGNAWEQCSPAFAAERCEARAKGVCHDCGIDTKELDHALRNLRCYHDFLWSELKRDVLHDILSIMRRRGWNCWKSWDALGQAHHIVKHSDGGELHPSNLVWLCVPCHKKRHGRKE